MKKPDKECPPPPTPTLEIKGMEDILDIDSHCPYRSTNELALLNISPKTLFFLKNVGTSITSMPSYMSNKTAVRVMYKKRHKMEL